jgi:hypothetical protein
MTYRIVTAAFILVLPALVSAEVIISEIMYNPLGADHERDWIELFNSGTDPVTIKGGSSGADSWRIYQESSTGSVNNRTLGTLAYQGDMIILSGEYLIVAADGVSFKVDYPGYTGKIITSGAMTLTSTISQKVGLRLGSSGTPWGVVTYSSEQGGNDDGQSLQLKSGAWVSAFPTPGVNNLSSTSSSAIQTQSNYSSTTSVSISTNSNNSNSNINEAFSAHFSSSELSSKKTEAALSVSAGRDRLGSVGSPMEFRAINDFEYTHRANFTWSFGDGTQGVGESLIHTYDYPGEYVVVLNVESPEGKGVARTNIKIIDPGLVISTATPQRIEIKNNSSYETSLYGWAMISGSGFFLFPKDTLIRAGQSVSFGFKATGLMPHHLNDVQLLMIGEIEHPKIYQKIEERKREKILSLQGEVEILKAKLVSLYTTHDLERRGLPTPSSTASTTQNLVISDLNKNDQSAVAARIKSRWLTAFKKFLLRNKE